MMHFYGEFFRGTFIVCEICQNCKLMVAALPSEVDHKMLIEKVVCDVSNRNCMLRRCENCPGIDELEKHLKQSFLEHDLMSLTFISNNGFIGRKVPQLWI